MGRCRSLNILQELGLVTSFWGIIEHDETTYGCKNHIPKFDKGCGWQGPEFLEWLLKEEKAFVLESSGPINIKVNWVKNPVKAQWHSGRTISLSITEMNPMLIMPIITYASLCKLADPGIAEFRSRNR